MPEKLLTIQFVAHENVPNSTFARETVVDATLLRIKGVKLKPHEYHTICNTSGKYEIPDSILTELWRLNFKSPPFIECDNMRHLTLNYSDAWLEWEAADVSKQVDDLSGIGLPKAYIINGLSEFKDWRLCLDKHMAALGDMLFDGCKPLRSTFMQTFECRSAHMDFCENISEVITYEWKQ